MLVHLTNPASGRYKRDSKKNKGGKPLRGERTPPHDGVKSNGQWPPSTVDWPCEMCRRLRYDVGISGTILDPSRRLRLSEFGDKSRPNDSICILCSSFLFSVNTSASWLSMALCVSSCLLDSGLRSLNVLVLSERL